MMDDTIAVYKPVGITSHQVAMRLAEKLGTVVTHTGSLDPMAEGVLVLLIGPEAKKKQTELQAVDKEYEFDLLFGFSTDSYDPLGLVTDEAGYETENFPENRLRDLVRALVGRRKQEVPPYSSIVVRGKPLFWWARQGRLDEVGLPVREIEISRAEVLGLNPRSKHDLEAMIFKKINSVSGDFRQDQIKEVWRAALTRHPHHYFSVATIRMTVGSGTYIRSIANEIGRTVGIPSLALRILRSRSGRFRVSDCRPLSDLI